jgi:trigger factor
MKSEITSSTDTSTTLKVVLEREALAAHVEQTFNRLRGRVKAAGFRPGKAPDHIVERELGSEVIQSEVVEQAVMHSYAKAVKEHDLPVIASPEVAISKFVPYTELEYTATVDVMPKVELTDYKKIRMPRPEVKVQDKEIDQVIEDLQRRMATREKVDRAAAKDDEVLIKFTGTKEGQPVPGASGDDYSLKLGSNTFIPGFEDQLIGLKAGEEKTFNITFPKDYSQTDLAGQEVTFNVAVKEVREIKLPEADEKFVSEVSPFKSMSELRDDIKQRLAEEKELSAEREYEDAVLGEIIEKSRMKLSERMVKQHIERLRGELADQLSYNGLDIEKYLKLRNQTEEDLIKELRPEAERRVKLAMVLSEISKAEGLSVSDQEVEGEIARLKAQYPDQSMQAELAKPDIRSDIYSHLLASKTVAKVLEYAQA